MKQLYTFTWSNGKTEKPLQAHTLNQALMVLVKRLAQQNPYENEKDIRIRVYTAFRNDQLNYTLDEPYQHVREPNQKPKMKDKKKPAQMSFKDFLSDYPDL